MKALLLAVVVVAGLGTIARAEPRHVMRASFPDGTGVEIFSQTTGASPIDSEGGMGIGYDIVNRLVVDGSNHILFVYDLEASRGAIPDTVMIRIRPINSRSEALYLKEGAVPGGPKYPGAHLPTVSGVRDFPAVKPGEAVTLDILLNPTTGEKVYDVLRPVPATRSGTAVESVEAHQTISLKQIAILINGQAIPAPASWMIGAAIRIDVPGHGSYVVAASDPHAANFGAVGHAYGDSLGWALDGDRVEITSATSVLEQSEKGALWVHHDAGFKSHDQPNAVRLQAADTVEWLLPKR